MNCYVMNRRGTFNTKKPTHNQCKVKGHKTYHYEVAMAFSPRVKLDENMFIIDHQDVDNCIQNCVLNGSCEEMHLEISEALRKLFKSREIPVIGMKAVIYPDLPAGAANLSYIWVSPKHSNVLPLLQLS
jgi:hypothetical protein